MKQNQRVHVSLDLDLDQVKLLMSVIELPIANEFSLDSTNQTEATLSELIERASCLDGAYDSSSYLVLKLAPIYRELLRHGADPEQRIGAIWEPASEEEWVEAERCARASLERN